MCARRKRRPRPIGRSVSARTIIPAWVRMVTEFGQAEHRTFTVAPTRAGSSFKGVWVELAQRFAGCELEVGRARLRCRLEGRLSSCSNIPAALLSWFYGLTASYTLAIGLMALVVIAITTPLTVKSTKNLLEMQRLEPELRRLQDEHPNDRVTLNDEMRKLYREHKVNPALPYLPMVAQVAVFVVMFGVLRGLTYAPHGSARPIVDAVLGGIRSSGPIATQGFIPRYLSLDSPLYESLFAQRRDDVARSRPGEVRRPGTRRRSSGGVAIPVARRRARRALHHLAAQRC